MYIGPFVLFYPPGVFPSLPKVVEMLSQRTGLSFQCRLDYYDRDERTIQPVEEIHDIADEGFYLAKAKDRIFKNYYCAVLYSEEVEQVIHVEIVEYTYHLRISDTIVKKMSFYFYYVFLDILFEMGGKWVEESGEYTFPYCRTPVRKKFKKEKWFKFKWDDPRIPTEYAARKGQPKQEDIDWVRYIEQYRKGTACYTLLPPK